MVRNSIIASTKESKKEGQEMNELICPNCQETGNVSAYRLDYFGDIEVKGIIMCRTCKHERPFKTSQNYIQMIDIDLPGTQSNKLISSVPSDIKEDIKEAERANYNQCYKACVTMCRRGLQLGLIDKEIPDQGLGKMIDGAYAKGLFLDKNTYTFAKTIKGLGDIGAHRRENLEPQEVNMVIYTTVKVLNELFSK